MTELFTREQIRQFIRENNLKDAKSVETAFAAQIGKVLQEILEEEMECELGYSKYDWKNKETENSRNGHTKKKVKTGMGEVELKIPRDVNGEFEPNIVKKHERVLGSTVEDRIIGCSPKA
jgi:transposase-like protein